jgi:hypothetical protein
MRWLATGLCVALLGLLTKLHCHYRLLSPLTPYSTVGHLPMSRVDNLKSVQYESLAQKAHLSDGRHGRTFP